MSRAPKPKNAGTGEFPTSAASKLVGQDTEVLGWALVRKTDGTTLVGYVIVNPTTITVAPPPLSERYLRLGERYYCPLKPLPDHGTLRLPAYRPVTVVLARKQVTLIERIQPAKAEEYATLLYCAPVGMLDDFFVASPHRFGG